VTEALKMIVDGYLSLKNRKALEEMRVHRERLRKQIEGRAPGGIDAGPTMLLFDEELHVIQAALASF
jgi:hypothetical protein